MGARRTSRWLVLAGAPLAGFAAWLFLYEPAWNGQQVPAPRTPMIFAHRGFGDYAPDNSLYAVAKALDAGMDGVDVDGQLTQDSVLVIFHDLSVDRLTPGTGKVRELSSATMLSLDLGPKHDSAITGALVHTFEDFVAAVKGRGILMVELKVPGMTPTGIEQQAVDIIRRHDAHERVILSSFNPFVLRRVKQADPDVRTAMIFMDTNWNAELLAEIRPEDRVDLPWVLRQEWIRRAFRKYARPDYLSINHEVDTAVTSRLIRKGWPVFIWTVNHPNDIVYAFSRQPWGIISDRPLLVRDLLESLTPPGPAGPYQWLRETPGPDGQRPPAPAAPSGRSGP